MAGEASRELGSAGGARGVGPGRGPERNHQGGPQFVDCVRMVHVRRDFIRVGKGWPEQNTWAVQWLRTLYQLNDRRLPAERGSAAFWEADDGLRQAVAAMKTRRETDVAGGARRRRAGRRRRAWTSIGRG